MQVLFLALLSLLGAVELKLSLVNQTNRFYFAVTQRVPAELRYETQLRITKSYSTRLPFDVNGRGPQSVGKKILQSYSRPRIVRPVMDRSGAPLSPAFVALLVCFTTLYDDEINPTQYTAPETSNGSLEDAALASPVARN